MKAFSSEQLDAINAQSTKGKFVEAVIFTKDPNNSLDKDYFVRWSRPISFKGNQYRPLDMAWSGIKTTANMELPSNQVIVSNLGGAVIDYLEKDDVNINGNDVVLQVLYIDKYNKISLIDEMLYQVEVVVADYHKAATFHLGVNFSLNDIVPNKTIETQEFPAIRDDVIRAGT
jgi:hypothetical protein